MHDDQLLLASTAPVLLSAGLVRRQLPTRCDISIKHLYQSLALRTATLSFNVRSGSSQETGVSPEEREKKSMVGIIRGTDNFKRGVKKKEL